MNFKLDENFETRTQRLFRDAGTKFKTVYDQGLQACTDNRLYETCCSERRCLVTLDLDFADVTRFPPAKANGIVVMRIPRNPSLTLLEQLIHQFLQALTQMSVEKRLWIIEIGRIRIHQEDTE